MCAVQIAPVDERDSSWEDDAPRFRVYLHGSGADETYGWTDTYAVALVRDEPGHGGGPGHDRGLVWLVGIDGNDTTDDDPPAYAAQQAMLARRSRPVTIIELDRAPRDLPSPYEDGR